MPELNTLVEDLYNLFDEENDHVVSEDNLDAFAEAAKELLRQRLRARAERSEILRFSNLGRPDRQIWYMGHASGEREKLSPKNALKFLYGDLIEQMLLFLVKEAGHTVEREQEELELDGVKGHIDAVIDGVTVDVKSASPMSYAKFEKGTLFENDPFGYIGQISSYASVVTPDTGGAFLAFDKVHGDVCLLTVGASITNTFGTAERISHLKDVLANDTAPPRCYPDEADGKSGNRKLGTQCSYCSYKNECWPGVRTFLYSGKPRFLTHVARQPEVPELTK